MHTIQTAAEQSGLTPDVIRIWERRYNAVTPRRTTSNQRIYRDQDVVRLSCLKRLTDNGRRISQVAQLTNEELQALVEQLPTAIPTPTWMSNNSVPLLTESALDAILNMDAHTFQAILEQALHSLGSVGFMLQFASPLLHSVGDMWRTGTVRTCQEHFASAHLRSFLGNIILRANTDPSGPRIVIATLPGQMHELGATMAAVTAAQSGWNVIYLGAGVPTEEIAFCADCKDAKAVAIGLGYPLDDPQIPAYLEELQRKLPPVCHLLVGGEGAQRHHNLLSELNIIATDSLPRLAAQLDALR